MKTFLLVEQAAQTREVVKSMIQNLGHYVVAVPDALTAQRIMSYILFDAVCTAYDDGLITAAEGTSPPTRVVLLLDKQLDSKKIIRFDSFLSKPFSISTLRDALEIALAHAA